MKRSQWLILGLALLVSLSFLLCGFSEVAAQLKNCKEKPDVIKWKGQTVFFTKMPPFGPFGPGETGAHAAMREWTEWIKKETGGRLVIDWVDPGTIFPPFEGDKAIGKGVVQIGVSYAGYFTGRMPEADVENGLVFAWPTVAAEYECLYKYGLYPKIKEVWAERNINWFPYHSDAIVGIGTSFAAPNPEAIKGKKIRAVGLWGDYVAMLGGSPVAVPWGEMYMGMKLGTLDGWIAGSAALEETKLKEVTKGYVLPRFNTALCNVLINMDAFKALPKDIQGFIERNHRYAQLALSTKWHQQCEWVLADSARKYGMKRYVWSDKDVKRVTQMAVDTLYPKVASKSPRCAEMVEIIKKQMRDYGRIK